MSVIKGSQSSTLQPFEYRYDPYTGPQTVQSFRGTYSEVAASANAYISAGWTVHFRQLPGGLSEMSAAIGADQQGIGTGTQPADESPDVWTLTANVVEKDLLESNTSAVGAITQANREKLQQYMKEPTAELYAEFSGDSLSLAKLIAKGVKTVLVMQPVIKSERLVASTYQTKQSMTRVGQVITTARMGNLEGVPADVLFNLPDETVNEGTASETAGWLKMHPTISDAAGGKYRISQEYQFGLWATLLYTINS